MQTCTLGWIGLKYALIRASRARVSAIAHLYTHIPHSPSQPPAHAHTPPYLCTGLACVLCTVYWPALTCVPAWPVYCVPACPYLCTGLACVLCTGLDCVLCTGLPLPVYWPGLCTVYRPGLCTVYRPLPLPVYRPGLDLALVLSWTAQMARNCPSVNPISLFVTVMALSCSVMCMAGSCLAG